MDWLFSGIRTRLAWVGLAAGLCWQAGFAAVPAADPDALIRQIYQLQVTDHARSLQVLAQLNQQAASLTPAQQWQMRYLNAWEVMYQGDYAKSESLLDDIIRHSGDPLLADRASAMLLSQLGAARHYTEAFELANRVAARLPQVTDAKVRRLLLSNLSQVMGSAGQTDLAVRYARMAIAAVPAGESQCYPASILVEALYYGKRLKSDSPELRQAFDDCPAAKAPLYNTNLYFMLAEELLREGQPRQVLALLDRIQPSVDANGYVPAQRSAQVDRATALAAIGQDDDAKRMALAVVAQGKSGDIDAWLKDAYQVLYRIEKKQGNAAAALDYYEKFAALDKAYLDDVHARAMAYETVQQHVLAQNLETERLGQQNAELLVQQKLAAKTAEASRLYLLLLLMALGFAAMWMYRLKRSQLRFERLSRLDGLTAIYNRQHFMGEAERMLQQLAKRNGAACLAFIDLDHFKRINDTHGHAMGDEVLRCMVAACKQHLRAVDLFGRLGGEEFGILLVDCSREQGIAIAERMRVTIEATVVEFDDVAVTASTSIGLAFTDAAGHDLRRLCADADAALYRAKHDGRNRVMAGVGDLEPA
ncbi:GGDEF domain-containing protein [Rhodanobacter sp. DHG33]|uniref:sensor domain-containing diguanylate cyclase n=1 Tax=Rhodanobacter sp. DHG33 TaxID=2775921 RepID=UPI001780B1CA|nr:GGDEF domain-containing protein [Rhodanobacter sp. DHG33]MBD8899205.1 GGDEF domain-containing protein [Rhodanobacter sp. DHG33]